MKFKNVKTLFFDYDGCIHNSMIIYIPAFKKAYNYLVEKNLAPKKDWKSDEISCWIGFNGRDMWEKFMPQLDKETKDYCYSLVGQEMLRLINEGIPKLYEGAQDTLLYLKNKGYTLVFLSNCRIGYKDAHNRLFNLDKYFDKLICSEEYDFIPKFEILNKIKENYKPEMIMIGDRLADIETGKKNHIYTIGCNYGFSKDGELKDADICINSIIELKNYL